MSEIDSNTGISFIDEISWTIVVYVLTAAIIVYIAWRSTYVRNENRGNLFRQRTVFIFNPQTGEFQQHSIGLSLNDLSAHLQAPPPPTLESILDEVNGIAIGATYHVQRQDDQLDSDLMEEETQEIIQDMDRDIDNDSDVPNVSDGLRHRRRPFPTDESSNENEMGDNEPIASTSTRGTRRHLPSTSSSIEDEPQIYPVRDVTPNTSNQMNDETDSSAPTNSTSKKNETVASASSTSEQQQQQQQEKILGNELTIKLKYLNDDLKIVKARPHELIGDFIKRNFSEELSAHKLVRLVFNGRVLQPDSKTVTACGLFDNCVVHCLIHNPRPNQSTPPQNQPIDNGNPPIPTINDEGNEQIGIDNLINATRNRNRNTQRLMNLSFFLICLSVIISWFFRIQYFQLFTWYSTVGLVLLTTFFLVIIPLIFLIEREIFRNL